MLGKKIFISFCIFIYCSQLWAIKVFPQETNEWGKNFAIQIGADANTHFYVESIESGFRVYTVGDNNKKFISQFQKLGKSTSYKLFEIT